MNENARFQRNVCGVRAPPPCFHTCAGRFAVASTQKQRRDASHELSAALFATDGKGSPVSAGGNLCSCLGLCQTRLRNNENPVITGEDRPRHNSLRRWVKKTQNNPTLLQLHFIRRRARFMFSGASVEEFARRKLHFPMISFAVRNTPLHSYFVRLSEDAADIGCVSGLAPRRGRKSTCRLLKESPQSELAAAVSHCRWYWAEEGSADSLTVCSPSFHSCV